MNALDLPTSLTIGEVAYSIRTGWLGILNLFSAMNDPDLDAEMKNEVLLQTIYPDWLKIPTALIPEALEKAIIDAGYTVRK